MEKEALRFAVGAEQEAEQSVEVVYVSDATDAWRGRWNGVRSGTPFPASARHRSR